MKKTDYLNLKTGSMILAMIAANTGYCDQFTQGLEDMRAYLIGIGAGLAGIAISWNGYKMFKANSEGLEGIIRCATGFLLALCSPLFVKKLQDWFAQ